MIGLSRDLRGIAFAFNTKVSYMMLFDWIYPQYTPILQRAVEIWYNDPQVHYKTSATSYFSTKLGRSQTILVKTKDWLRPIQYRDTLVKTNFKYILR